MAVSTAAMLARRKIFEDLGGLDPNLALFRDDVDLGWRARVAGFSVLTAPQALVYHAEAAASERRSVDVEEAFLHRPRLLDRKNAAYVLLANASWWLLPWITIQIVGSAAIRAVGYLIAKLPGYAADEIAAVGLLIIKPKELIVGRKLRKQKRLLSPRVIRQFIPPPGSQIRLALEQASYSLRNYFKADIDEDSNLDEPMSYADIGVIDESFDDQDVIIKPRRSNWQTLRNRPLLIGIAFTFFVSLIASRHRFGSISGGALAVAPSGAMDLIAKYSESWHLVGLGSAASTPPWVAILAGASALTFGKIWLFLTIFLLLAPTLTFFTMYRSAKRAGLSIRLSALGGVIYAMSPVIWNSINQGRIGTLAVAMIAPSFLSFLPRTLNFETISWRKTYALILMAALLSAFSTFFLITWTTFFLIFLMASLFNRRDELKTSGPVKFAMTSDLGRIKRALALFLIPGLLNAPWSTSVILHPTQILLDPGLAMPGGSFANIFMLNPGGVSGVPGWILSPFIIFLIAITVTKKYQPEAASAIGLFSLAILLSQMHIFGHGSSGQVWTGTLILFIEIIILVPTLRVASQLIPNLRNSKLGISHFVSVAIVITTSFSILATSLWAVTGGANSLVTGGKSEVVPPFIASLSDTPNRPKTLVIGRTGEQLNYFVTRGYDLEIGDADVAVATPSEVRNAIIDLVSGAGIASSKILGAYGIQYLFLRNPIDQGVARTVDGIGGFTRSSSTNAGIIWQVVASKPRISVQDVTGSVTGLNSARVGAVDELQTPGTVTLAEKFDTGWKLIVNGNQMKLKQSQLGLPYFEVTETGPLILLHDGTKHRALISAQLIALLTVIVLSLPAGRRRREVPLEELA